MLTNTYQKLAIYMTPSCNLNCNKCYLKNYIGGAPQIDHPQDYSMYIDRLLETNPKNKDTLQIIELHGGEPTLELNSFISALPSFIENFPKLREISFNTNLATDDCVQIIHRLCDKFKELQPDGIIKIQVSIAGPTALNDYGRAVGLTETILENIQALNRPNLQITTNSIFTRKNLYSFIEYKNVEEWFDFFLRNFPQTVKFKLFSMIKDISPGASLTGTYWNDFDGQRYAQVLQWADQWRTSHPEESKRFIWPEYRINLLDTCDVTLPNNIITLSPTGQQALCHRGVYEQRFVDDEHPVRAIDLSQAYRYLTDRYNESYKDYMNIVDFKQSMLIYINLNWCPYLWSFGPGMLESFWFSNEIPLLYNGAMNILLKWSREK